MIFGGDDIPKEYTTLDKAKAVIIGCAYGKTASYQQGTEKGPQAIIEASNHIELFDDELKKETFKSGIFTEGFLPIAMLAPEIMVEKVYEKTKYFVEKGILPVVLGGEHSVSIGSVKAVAQKYKDISVLHLDAHYDLRDSYEGSKNSHACAARRFLDYAEVVEVGVRSLSKEEHAYLLTKPKGLYIKDMQEILYNDSWQEDSVDLLKENVYISVDLDVFDPAYMPSTGTPEPGGLNWYDITTLIKKVSEKKKIVGFDVVELMPVEKNKASDFMAAKLVYRILGYVLNDKEEKC